MREFDEVRERFARIQDYILSALAEARGELYDLPDTVEHELENLISQAEYYAEDLVSVVDNYEEDFVPGGVVTVYNVPVTLRPWRCASATTPTAGPPTPWRPRTATRSPPRPPSAARGRASCAACPTRT